MSAASSKQIGAIHAIAKRVGLDDAVYRSILSDETGKTSAKELTYTEAGRVIERLKAVQGAAHNTAPSAKGAIRMDGGYAGKLRALWIAGFHLGVVHDRTDRALASFIERQTGLSHPRFLIEAHAAAKAIEGLKQWLAREAGVRWPPLASADPLDLKRAVVIAIANRLAQLGEETPGAIMHCSPAQLDHVAEVHGSKLRRALAKTGGAG